MQRIVHEPAGQLARSLQKCCHRDQQARDRRRAGLFCWGLPGQFVVFPACESCSGGFGFFLHISALRPEPILTRNRRPVGKSQSLEFFHIRKDLGVQLLAVEGCENRKSSTSLTLYVFRNSVASRKSNRSLHSKRLELQVLD